MLHVAQNLNRDLAWLSIVLFLPERKQETTRSALWRRTPSCHNLRAELVHNILTKNFVFLFCFVFRALKVVICTTIAVSSLYKSMDPLYCIVPFRRRLRLFYSPTKTQVCICCFIVNLEAQSQTYLVLSSLYFQKLCLGR